MEIIKQIEKCQHLTAQQKRAAVKDIRKMITVPEYAKMVYFRPAEQHLPNMFAWENSDLGKNFWHDLYIRLLHN